MTPPIRVAHVTTVDLSLRFLLLDQLRRLRDEGFEVSAISAPGPWTGELASEGIRHIEWPHATRAWDPRADIVAYRELVEILRRERFDILHTHNPKPGVLGRLAGKRVGVPYIVNTVHGLYASPTDRWRRKAPVLLAERLAARWSDVELYQSSEDLVWAKRLGIARDGRSILLGNGVDLAHFDPHAVPSSERDRLRRELGIGEDELVIGAVGRLVAEKGYRELFEAASRIRSEVPTVRFLVVGDPDRSKPDAISEGEMQRARKDVVFAGWRADVRDLLAAMDVFVLASWREGLPRSAVEAAAMARPLVLTDIRGCREVARDGIEGVLVPVRDPGALTAAIKCLILDPAMRARYGAAARARAEAAFDGRRVGDIVVETYRRLVGERARGGASSDRTAPDIRLRKLRAADRSAVARLHHESLPDAFLPALGDGFLRNLYRALASDEDAVCTVAENGAGIVGFVAGTRSVGRTYRRFALRRGPAAALSAAPRLIRPAIARRAIETARYPAGSQALPAAELLSIAVAPEWRGRGVGEMLTADLLHRLRERGVSELKVVVAGDNLGARRFYERLGFRSVARIEVHDGTPSDVMVAAWTS